MVETWTRCFLPHISEPGILGRLEDGVSGGSGRSAREQSSREKIARKIAAENAFASLMHTIRCGKFPWMQSSRLDRNHNSPTITGEPVPSKSETLRIWTEASVGVERTITPLPVPRPPTTARRSKRFLLTPNRAKHPLDVSLRAFDQRCSLCPRCCCYRRL